MTPSTSHVIRAGNISIRPKVNLLQQLEQAIQADIKFVSFFNSIFYDRYNGYTLFTHYQFHDN